MRTYSPTQVNEIAGRVRAIAERWLDAEYGEQGPDAREAAVLRTYADLQELDSHAFAGWFSRHWGIYAVEAEPDTRERWRSIAALICVDPEFIQSLTFLALGSLRGGAGHA